MAYTPGKAAGVSRIGKVKLPSYFMLALTLIGIADAVYVAHGNVTGAPLCPHPRRMQHCHQQPVFARLWGADVILRLYLLRVHVWIGSAPCLRSVLELLRFRAILYAALGAASSMYFMYVQIGLFAKFVVIASSLP